MSAGTPSCCRQLRRLVGIEHQRRDQVRPVVAVRDRLGDPAALLELVLDVGGGDVLAARGDDEVLLAPGDRHEAVVVDRAEVAGGQPPLGQRLPGGLLVLEIAAEHDRTSRQQLAVVGDAQLQPRHRLADRGDPHLRVGVERAGTAHLGHSPHLQQADAAGIEELNHLTTDRSRGADGELQPAAEQLDAPWHGRGDPQGGAERRAQDPACDRRADAGARAVRPSVTSRTSPAGTSAGLRPRWWRPCRSSPTPAAPTGSRSDGPPWMSSSRRVASRCQ